MLHKEKKDSEVIKVDIPDWGLAERGRGHRVYRVPGLLSSRLNWLPPPPHPQASVALPLGSWEGGGGNTLACRRGGGGSHSDEGTDTLVL